VTLNSWEKNGRRLYIPIIHQLAAKLRIQDWQYGEGLQGLSIDKMVINLRIKASIVSNHTAYVAADEKHSKPIAGAIKTWDIMHCSNGRARRQPWLERWG